jgi:hypothetical protein
MPLGAVRTTYDVANGHTLLEIASNKWLSTTSINSIMYSLTSVHSDVGVVKAEFFTIKNDTMRDRTHAPSYIPVRRRVLPRRLDREPLRSSLAGVSC